MTREWFGAAGAGRQFAPAGLSGPGGRPLNFTVRRLFSVSRTLFAVSYSRGE